jgi:hypothetical protein
MAEYFQMPREDKLNLLTTIDVYYTFPSQLQHCFKATKLV